MAASILLAAPAVAQTAWDRIDPNGPQIHIVEFAQVPASSKERPKARIAQMKPVGDGTKRLAVNDLNGPLHLIREGKVLPYLDLSTEIGAAFMTAPGLNSGFSSVAFHPEFARNGKFYTVHTEKPGSGKADFTPANPKRIEQQGVLLEWTARDPKADRFEGTRRELMRVDMVLFKHGFQEVAFNPNAKPGSADWGKLYIALGDTATTEARIPENTHRLDSPLGSILRIDPLGKNSANGRYGIPADNPFMKDKDAKTLGEIWAWGFRNPHRLAWDKDGRLFAVDIGEKNWEEINLIEPGRDYGWNLREGTDMIDAGPRANHDVIQPLPADDAKHGFTYPVAQYSHIQGDAIAGGYVYRRRDNPALYGKFIFGDIKTGRLFTVDADKLIQGRQVAVSEPTLFFQRQETTMARVIGDRSRQDIRFGYDDEDGLYILEKREGRIFRIVPAPVKQP